jgi:hypothetical protein
MEETAVNPAVRVICALKDRKLPINRNEVESALIDNKKNVENIQWVEEHLGPDTLLSQEELTLYVLPSPPRSILILSILRRIGYGP